MPTVHQSGIQASKQDQRALLRLIYTVLVNVQQHCRKRSCRNVLHSHSTCACIRQVGINPSELNWWILREEDSVTFAINSAQNEKKTKEKSLDKKNFQM